MRIFIQFQSAGCLPTVSKCLGCLASKQDHTAGRRAASRHPGPGQSNSVFTMPVYQSGYLLISALFLFSKLSGEGRELVART